MDARVHDINSHWMSYLVLWTTKLVFNSIETNKIKHIKNMHTNAFPQVLVTIMNLGGYNCVINCQTWDNVTH
jgi:hypothetical protein